MEFLSLLGFIWNVPFLGWVLGLGENSWAVLYVRGMLGLVLLLL